MGSLYNSAYKDNMRGGGYFEVLEQACSRIIIGFNKSPRIYFSGDRF